MISIDKIVVEGDITSYSLDDICILLTQQDGLGDMLKRVIRQTSRSTLLLGNKIKQPVLLRSFKQVDKGYETLWVKTDAVET